MVAGGRRGCRFGNRPLLLPARGGEPVPARPGTTGSRCTVKLAVQRRRYRGADLCTVGTGAGCMAATAD